MEEIFKVYLSIWIMITIVTIIPNTLLLIKIIKGKFKGIGYMSYPEFICAWAFFIMSIVVGTIMIYRFL